MTGNGNGTLADEQRELARQRILGAARRVVATRGLDTRVEDVAEAAAVSRRTVFRYFPTRDELLAAALHDSLHRYREHVPWLEPGGDLDTWLREALVAVHRLNARSGRIYLQLALERDMPQELAAVYAERRQMRIALVSRFATTAYEAAGGQGAPPAWLLEAVAVHLSPFATQALVGDFDRSPEESGSAAAQILSAAIKYAATMVQPSA